MAKPIVSLLQIKALLGISGTSKDYLISQLIRSATSTVCDLLNISEIAKVAYQNELTQINGCELTVNNFNPDPSSVVLLDSDQNVISGYTFELASNTLRTLIASKEGKIFQIPFDATYVNYNAGFTAYDLLEILDNDNLATKSFSILSTTGETFFTFVASAPTQYQIQIGANVVETMTNIATKIGGFIVEGKVGAPLGSSIESGTLGDTDAVITPNDLPPQFVTAICALVGDGISELRDKRGGVTSYSLGTKSVSFSSKSNKEEFEECMRSLRRFQKVTIHSI